MRGDCPEGGDVGEGTPASRKPMRIGNDQRCQCFLYLLLNTHTGDLSPGNSGPLTGHQDTSRPARKKPPTVPLLVFSIAWAGGEAGEGQSAQMHPRPPTCPAGVCVAVTFQPLKATHFPGNRDTAIIFTGLQNHSCIETLRNIRLLS